MKEPRVLQHQRQMDAIAVADLLLSACSPPPPRTDPVTSHRGLWDAVF